MSNRFQETAHRFYAADRKIIDEAGKIHGKMLICGTPETAEAHNRFLVFRAAVGDKIFEEINDLWLRKRK